jgi:hypothetical protein
MTRTYSTKQNIKTSAKDSLGLHEMKQHKPRFDEECLGILDRRKQAEMQWIQDTGYMIQDTGYMIQDTGSKPKQCKT